MLIIFTSLLTPDPPRSPPPPPPRLHIQLTVFKKKRYLKISLFQVYMSLKAYPLTSIKSGWSRFLTKNAQCTEHVSPCEIYLTFALM